MGVFKFTTSSAPGRSCADDPCQPPASDADSSLAGFRPLDCPLRLRVDDAFACYREDDKDWIDAWGTQQSCSASRHATLASHLYANREPAPEEQSPRRSPGHALRSDQRSRRLTDKLQDPPQEPWTCTRFVSELAGLAPQWAVACGQRTRGRRLRHRQRTST